MLCVLSEGRLAWLSTSHAPKWLSRLAKATVHAPQARVQTYAEQEAVTQRVSVAAMGGWREGRWRGAERRWVSRSRRRAVQEGWATLAGGCVL